MNAVSPPPAGWYPDPSGRAPFRYWDGARWTEHTDQGTAPAPSPTAPMAPAPAPMYTQAAPAYQPAAPVYAPGAPVGAAAPAGGAWTAQSFMEDVKKLQGLALVVVGVIVFILVSFLPWAEGKLSYVDTSTGVAVESSDSGNAWDSEGTPWLIRGFGASEFLNRTTAALPESGSDMIILLPLALIAAGAAVGSRLGKKIQYANEIVLGASGLLAVLVIAEAVHVSGEIDDLTSGLAARGAAFDSGITYGFYLGIAATLVMAGGAVKHYLANKQAKA